MNSSSRPINRREFPKKATQATAAVAASGGLGSVADPLVARAGEAARRRAEYLAGTDFKETGHTLYLADFDAEKRTITNLKAFANADGKPHWYAYPRWIDGESAVVYLRIE